jgi:hypothetical protein
LEHDDPTVGRALALGETPAPHAPRSANATDPLLPLIGNIVWYVKVQRVLNEFWLSKGSRPA